VLRGLGAAAGSLGHVVDRRHRRITHDNLRTALGPEVCEREVRRIARRCWRHFGRITADTLCFYRMPLERLEHCIDYEGLEHVRAAYAAHRGVLLFSGHFGHWELIALMQGHLGMPLALVARPLDNPRLETLLAGVRQRSGNRILHKRNASRDMLRALRSGAGVAIVIDQDARRDGIFVPFFGRPASTTPSLALMAVRTGAAVVPTFSIPLPGGRYRVVYEPPVAVPASGDVDRDVRDLTAACTAILERWVRSHPELWLWMHRRWKTAPPPSAAAVDAGAPGGA
jgi:KDO2-lipid IV(A) lauroyltransferase